MNEQEARLVAAFLGKPYCVSHGNVQIFLLEPDENDCSEYFVSDADLLLACLERARELKLGPSIEWRELEAAPTVGWWAFFWNEYEIGGTGPTPLAAIIAAICAYQEQA